MQFKIRPYSRRKTTVVKLIGIFAVFFFFYQFLFLFALTRYYDKTFSRMNDSDRVRGAKISDLCRYKPDESGMFTCFDGGERIPFEMVNDDYCDCTGDGSDEPGTGACGVGRFHCWTQIIDRSGKVVQESVPPSRVNDGICDCCDGSDEWKNVSAKNQMNARWQSRLGVYQTPCSFRCK